MRDQLTANHKAFVMSDTMGHLSGAVDHNEHHSTGAVS